MSTAEERLDSAATARFRQIALAGLVAFAIVTAVFYPTAAAVASIWWRSETFAHGLVVLPISLWLLWGMRKQLAAIPLRPSWLPLIPLMLSGFAWLIGESASVAALSHFALAGMLVSAVWAVWGHALAWQAAFPLAFIFFGVPFGEFLVPALMNHTADFTVAALRLTGVPVFREGNSFIIPSGSWSVVEACSGIRYLIASVMVGFLFAWLNYRSWRRRVLFILAAVAVPLIANWLRAYIIVMLGHLSDNKIATGVDHLIYGWVFFGVVIAALFWVGAIWRESDDVATPSASAAALESGGASMSRVAMAWLAVCAVVLIWPPLERWLANTPAARSYQLEAPRPAPGWVSVGDQPVANWRPSYFGDRTRVVQTYRLGDQTLTLFIAYYAQQTPGRELVQWDNRLVTAEDKDWREVGSELEQLGGSLDVRRTRLLRHGTDRLEAWSWFWLGDATSADSKHAKLALVKDRFARRADDSAALIIYASQAEANTSSRKLVEQFLIAHQHEINRVLREAPRR